MAACEIVLKRDENNVDALIQHAEALLILGSVKQIERAQRSLQKAIDQGSREAQEVMQRANRALHIAKRKDYYKILGLEKTASARDIRKAYKRAALKYHPDKIKKSDITPEEAQEKYADVQEAYEVLNDPEKRKRWDRGEDVNDRQQQGFNPFHGSGFPFGGFGGGGGGFNFNFRRG